MNFKINSLFKPTNKIYILCLIMGLITYPHLVSAASKGEQEIAAQIAEMPPLEEGFTVDFKKIGKSFSINGEEFIDFEGDIINWEGNPLTGDVTYAIKESDGIYLIKYFRVSTDVEPITIAKIKTGTNVFKAFTTSGKKIGGHGYVQTSNGFLILRSGSAYLYTAGKGVKAARCPEGFFFVKKQYGEIGATKHALVAKNHKKDIISFGSLLNSVVGIEGSSDFGLVNLETKEFTPLAIANTKQGKPKENWDDISNRLRWFQDITGTYAIYTKNNLKKTVVINLDTGKEKTLYEGTAQHPKKVDWEMQPNGKAKITLTLTYAGEKVIDDIAAFMAKEEVMGKKEHTSESSLDN